MNTDKKKKPAVVTFFTALVINMIRKYKGIMEHTCATVCYIVPQIAASLVCQRLFYFMLRSHLASMPRRHWGAF